MAQESKFKDVKGWKELQAMVGLTEVLQALRQAEYQKAYRSRYNKKKNLFQKIIREKIASGEINIEEIEELAAKVA